MAATPEERLPEALAAGLAAGSSLGFARTRARERVIRARLEEGVHDEAKHAATGPRVRADEAQAQARAQNCVSKANFLTRGGRKAFISCLRASRGNEVAVEKCAERKFAPGGALTRTARKRLNNDGVSTCTLR